MSLITVLFFVFCISSLAYGTFVEDYCWRDYDGTIPSDAYKAGIDRDGQPIYIGQVLFEDKLIPGKIYHNKKQIHIEFWQAFTVNETIKILCSHQPEHFKWIRIDTNQVPDLKKEHILFEGGYEKDIETYIGRARSFNELTVGKVVCRLSSCMPLSTVEAGEFHQHDEFEILTYNPNGKGKQQLLIGNSAGNSYSTILLLLVFCIYILKYTVSFY